jgi:secreted trypsin-like serine protease
MLSNITVCAGSDRLSDSCLQSRSVRQVIIHHGYKNKTHEHDIAIVQLDEPFDFTDRWISKICLPSAETESPYPPAGTSVLAIGWGKTERDNTASDKLQQVTLQVIDDSTSSCSNLLYNKEVQLCASGPNKSKPFLRVKYPVFNFFRIDTCKGDSGGPLMQFTAENRWELVGITSYGNPNCTLPNRPGAYVRVSVYHNFIKSVIQNTYTPPVNKLYTCECQCPYGTDSGVALTSTYSAESCIRACISISRNPCSSRNTYACLNSSCIYSSFYEHLTTNTTSELDLNLTCK